MPAGAATDGCLRPFSPPPAVTHPVSSHSPMSDIRTTLQAVCQRMNEFIRAAEPRPEDWVVLSNLVDPDGKPVEATRGKLVMFLAGIQKESLVSTYNGAVPAGEGFAIVPPPLYVDLYVLLLANFYDANYADGLGMISLAISFFQQYPSFTPVTLPGLPADVDRLSWEMTNLDPLNLSYLMGIAGVKYLPSAYYKVRLLPFQSGGMVAQASPVRGAQAPGSVPEPDPAAAAARGARRGR